MDESTRPTEPESATPRQQQERPYPHFSDQEWFDNAVKGIRAACERARRNRDDEGTTG